jgi:hypothetical protein
VRVTVQRESKQADIDRVLLRIKETLIENGVKSREEDLPDKDHSRY